MAEICSQLNAVTKIKKFQLSPTSYKFNEKRQKSPNFARSSTKIDGEIQMSLRKALYETTKFTKLGKLAKIM